MTHDGSKQQKNSWRAELKYFEEVITLGSLEGKVKLAPACGSDLRGMAKERRRRVCRLLQLLFAYCLVKDY